MADIVPSFDRTAFSVVPARYAKGKSALHPVSDGSGFKSRAANLAEALGGKWSNREKAYIMSPAAVTKFDMMRLAGIYGYAGIMRGCGSEFFDSVDSECPEMDAHAAMRLANRRAEDRAKIAKDRANAWIQARNMGLACKPGDDMREAVAAESDRLFKARSLEAGKAAQADFNARCKAATGTSGTNRIQFVRC